MYIYIKLIYTLRPTTAEHVSVANILLGTREESVKGVFFVKHVSQRLLDERSKLNLCRVLKIAAYDTPSR
jgi:hypothetical protein